MSWKTLLESVSGSLNDHIQLRAEYLMAENRILRNQITGRVRLTDTERKELAELGAKLGKTALKEIATIATPDTILSWNRKFANLPVVASKPPESVGRPRLDPKIEALVLRMARQDRSWGYDRIQGSLNHLDYKISGQTVGNILKRHGIAPAPERNKTITWREFTRSHLDILLATDFFNSDVWSGFGLFVSYLFSLLYFAFHPIQAVRFARYQPMQSFRVLMCRILVFIEDWLRWVYLLAQRPRARRADERALAEQTGSELDFANVRPMRSQDTSKVIILAAVRPQQSRDGPIRQRQECVGFLTGVNCKAA